MIRRYKNKRQPVYLTRREADAVLEAINTALRADVGWPEDLFTAAGKIATLATPLSLENS